jgi:hypothetical protein
MPSDAGPEVPGPHDLDGVGPPMERSRRWPRRLLAVGLVLLAAAAIVGGVVIPKLTASSPRPSVTPGPALIGELPPIGPIGNALLGSLPTGGIRLALDKSQSTSCGTQPDYLQNCVWTPATLPRKGYAMLEIYVDSDSDLGDAQANFPNDNGFAYTTTGRLTGLGDAAAIGPMLDLTQRPGEQIVIRGAIVVVRVRNVAVSVGWEGALNDINGDQHPLPPVAGFGYKASLAVAVRVAKAVMAHLPYSS